MANHSGIRDTGIQFEIVPNTRTIAVPKTHRVIGVAGDHLSEEVTFRCPKDIDGHDVLNCAEHFVVYRNADGLSKRVNIERDEIKETEDGEDILIPWAVDDVLTACAGTVWFSVYFVDKDDAGNVIYRWGTSECGDCQVLSGVEDTNPVINPEGIISITANGKYNVSEFEYAKVNVPNAGEVPEGYIKPEGKLDITENGEYNVTPYESVNVDVTNVEYVASPLPVEIESEQEMNNILAKATSAYVGAVYKYVGAATMTYEKDALYILGVAD